MSNATSNDSTGPEGPERPQLALYQPDIPQNAGAILRLAACMGVSLQVVEPAGFVWSDTKLKRAGLDYIASAHLIRRGGWTEFRDAAASGNKRIVLFTTKGTHAYTDFAFSRDDILLFGSESAGVPEEVHDSVHERLLIPMYEGMRSINVAQCAAMALGEALRQTGGFPKTDLTY